MTRYIARVNDAEAKALVPVYAMASSAVPVELYPNGKDIVEDEQRDHYAPALVTDDAINNFVYDE